MPQFRFTSSAGRFLVAQHAFARMSQELRRHGVELSAEDLVDIRSYMVDELNRRQAAAGLEPRGFSNVMLAPNKKPNHVALFASLYRDAALHKFGSAKDNPASPYAKNYQILNQRDAANSLSSAAAEASGEFLAAYNSDNVLVNGLGMTRYEVDELRLSGFHGIHDSYVYGQDNAGPISMVPVDSLSLNGDMLRMPFDKTDSGTSIADAMRTAQLVPAVRNQPGVYVPGVQTAEINEAYRYLRDGTYHPELHVTRDTYRFCKSSYVLSRMLEVSEQHLGMKFSPAVTSRIMSEFNRVYGPESWQTGQTDLFRSFDGNGTAVVPHREQDFANAFVTAMRNVGRSDSPVRSDDFNALIHNTLVESANEFDTALMDNPSGPKLLVNVRASSMRPNLANFDSTQTYGLDTDLFAQRSPDRPVMSLDYLTDTVPGTTALMPVMRAELSRQSQSAVAVLTRDDIQAMMPKRPEPVIENMPVVSDDEFGGPPPEDYDEAYGDMAGFGFGVPTEEWFQDETAADFEFVPEPPESGFEELDLTGISDSSKWHLSERAYQYWKSQYAFSRMVDVYAEMTGSEPSPQDVIAMRSSMNRALSSMATVRPVQTSGAAFADITLGRYFNPVEEAGRRGVPRDEDVFVQAFVDTLPETQRGRVDANQLKAALMQSVGEFDSMLDRDNPVLLLNNRGMSEAASRQANAFVANSKQNRPVKYMGVMMNQVVGNNPGMSVMSLPDENISGGVSIWTSINSGDVYPFDVSRMRAAGNQPLSRAGDAPQVEQRGVEWLSTISDAENLSETSLLTMFNSQAEGNRVVFTPEGRAQMDYFIRQNAYHDLIQKMNASLAERGLDTSNGVTTRTASFMLDHMENFDRLHPRDFAAELSRVIDTLPSDDFVKTLWKDTLRDVTSGANAGWWEASRNTFEQNLAYKGILTLSPFDINFRNRKVAMDKGHKALYVRYDSSEQPIPKLTGRLHGDDVGRYFGDSWGVYDYGYNWEADSELNELLKAAGDDINNYTLDERELFSSPDIHKNPLFQDIWSNAIAIDKNTNRQHKMTERDMERRLSFMRSRSMRGPDFLMDGPEDLSGLSALRPYMSPKNYQELSQQMIGDRPWCAGCVKVDAKGNQTVKYMSPETIERVRQTVDMLAASGETFTFEKDINPGQVRIRFNNGMTMRVIDPENEDFACNQIYHSGASMYYQVQAGSSKSYVYRKVTPQMSVDLIKFARGEAVTRDPSFNLSEHVTELDGTVLENKLGMPATVKTKPKYAKPGYNNRPPDGVRRQAAYTNKSGTSFNVLVDVLPLGATENAAQPTNDMALIINVNYENRQASNMSFDDVTYIDKLSDGTGYERVSKGSDRAEAYLRDCIDKAREGFDAEVDIDGLIQEAAEVQARIAAGEDVDDSVYSRLSSNPDIQAIQSKYWGILTGRQAALLKPAYDTDMQFDGDEDADFTDSDAIASHVYQNMTPEEMVRAHRDDLKQYLIGQFEPVLQPDPEHPDGEPKEMRFSPSMVCRYMNGANMSGATNKNITAACKALNLTTDELKYFNAFDREVAASKLVNFDEESKQNIFNGEFGSDTQNAFMKSMGEAIVESLQSNGCEVSPEDIMIDKNGIVHYEAKRIISSPTAPRGAADKRGAAEYVKFHGEIGKIYAPREDGVVVTDRFVATPGYQARIEPNKPGENKPYEERIVLTSYADAMKSSIRSRIRQDLTTVAPRIDGITVENKLTAESGVTESELTVGSSFSVDNTLRNFIDVRYPLDFIDDKAVQARGMDLDTRNAIIAMGRTKVKFSKDFMTAANEMPVFTALNGVNGERRDVLNDNCMDALTLTGYRNIALLESPGDGMFDPFATGNANAQGVRYLAEGATVTPDGHVIPGSKDLNSREARCAMVNYLRDHGRYPDFDSPDRMNMDINSIMHCIRVSEPVGIAQFDCGMFTLEDGPVVSKKFAEMNAVPDHATGEPRPLGRGDKIGCHGNKGVISRVVDPDMPEDEAKKQGVWNLVQWFKANPNLDVIMSSYSGPARFNAGLAVEAINSNPETLVNPFTGEEHSKSIGHVSMIIMEQTADAKTHYDVENGDGRSYGAQMTWALSAKGCTEVMKTAFRTNVKASSNLREMCISLGLDVDPTGRFQLGYHPHPGEVRNVFELPDLRLEDWPAKDPNGMHRLHMLSANMKDLDAQFDEWLSTRGGFMELPFPLKYKSSRALESIGGELAKEEAKAKVSLEKLDVKLQEGDKQGYMDAINGLLAQHGYPDTEMVSDLSRNTLESLASNEQLVYLLSKEKGNQLADVARVVDAVNTLKDVQQRRTEYTELMAGGGVGTTDVYDPEKYGREGGPHSTMATWTRHAGDEKNPIDTELPPAVLGGEAAGRKSYVLPVISSYLRAGQELADGELKVHDWTNHYKTIFKNSIEYQKSQAKLDYIMTHRDEMQSQLQYAADKANDTTRKKRLNRPMATPDSVFNDLVDKFKGEMNTAQAKAQTSYAAIATELETRKFSGKHNIFRAGIMANKQPNSCTAVWSADPNLGVDEMAMPGAMMQALGLKENEYALVHRDPVLYGSAVRYMKIKQDDTLVGVSVHPAGIPGGMQGDFDGDTVGPRAFDRKDTVAKIEAMDKLSVSANLLNTYVDKKQLADGTMGYPLFIGLNQDVTTGMIHGDGLRERLAQIEVDVNKAERELEGSPEKLAEARNKAIEDINGFLRDCAQASEGHNVMSYASKTANILCNEAIVQSGAKGKIAGVDMLARNMGVEYVRDGGDGHIIESTIKEHDVNISSRDSMCSLLRAKNMQQQYTGMAGDNTIKHQAALMNICPEEACGLGGAVTDATLQVKHDGAKAIRFEMLMTSVSRDMTSCLRLTPTKRTVQIYDPDAELKDTAGNPVIDPETGEARKGAFKKMEMPTWGRHLVWSSRTSPDGSKTYASFRPHAATCDEYIEQLEGVYNSKDGFALSVKKDYMETVATVLSTPQVHAVAGKDKNNHCVNMVGKFKPVYGSPLQRCAYTVTPGALYKMAYTMAADPEAPGLYDTPKCTVEAFKDGVVTPSGNLVGKLNNVNRCIADGSAVRRNLDMRDAALASCQTQEEKVKALQELAKSYQPIVRQDVLVTGKANIARVKIADNLIATVDAPKREVDMPEPASQAMPEMLNPDKLFSEFNQFEPEPARVAVEPKPVEQPAPAEAPKPVSVEQTRDSAAPAPIRKIAPEPAPEQTNDLDLSAISLSAQDVPGFDDDGPFQPVLPTEEPAKASAVHQSSPVCDKNLSGLQLDGADEQSVGHDSVSM